MDDDSVVYDSEREDYEKEDSGGVFHNCRSGSDIFIGETLLW